MCAFACQEETGSQPSSISRQSSRNTQAIKSAGIDTPARIYDLRSTFASNALAAGVTVFELAKVMGTSVAMIERHYGTLIGGAHAGIAGRLDALEAELERANEPEVTSS
jgi:hypothetical protein